VKRAPSAVHALLRANNRVWAALYYDELVETPAFQLTAMAGADAGYYNCAQAVTNADPATLDAVEAFYQARGLPPAFYLDPDSAPGLEEHLVSRGYQETCAEEERCLVHDAARLPPPGSLLRLPPDRVRLAHLGGPEDPLFGAFLHVDGAANDLPARIVDRLAANLRSPAPPGVELRCLLALVDGEPAASCLVGLHEEYALFAECGTLPEHRRRGLFSALVLSGLALARGRGAGTALLTAAASAHSVPAAQGVGFRLLCTRRYFCRPLTAAPRG
jgi:GNAT superfamily N-acetyltransferase